MQFKLQETSEVLPSIDKDAHSFTTLFELLRHFTIKDSCLLCSWLSISESLQIKYKRSL